MKKNLIISLIIGVLIIVSGCSSDTQIQQQNSLSSEFDSEGTKILEKDTLKKISSKDELKELMLKEEVYSNNFYYYDFGLRSFGVFDEAVAVDSMMVKSVSESYGGAQEYSTTNNQVQNVDEADIVKNDGKYIYTLTGNSIAIVDAYPAENGKLLSKIDLESDKNIQKFFVNNNQLIIFANSYIQTKRVNEKTLMPYTHYEDQTEVLIYSIKSRENPELIKSYSLTGSFYQARLMGDYVYFISQEYLNSYDGPIFPILYKDGLRIAEPDIYYFDFKSNSNYYSIGSINLNNLDKYNVESYLLESGSTFYMSESNMYIAYQKRIENNYIEQFEETIMPSIKESRKEIFEKHINKKDNEAIAITLEEYLHNLNEEEIAEFEVEVENRYQEYIEKIQAEERKTVIQKLSIEDDGLIYYHTKGEVEGYLLNQFSMDEKDSNLRVGTTTSYWIRGEGSHSYNNVYVLDENLNQIGSIENLAEDERIYSTRFMGDKLYMVTFKQIDPLFVIDLSTPEQPRVEGELKVSGYSSYLHPYGENFLIGIGKETKENQWGGVSDAGVKISLFDISDVKNPKEIDKYVIEGKYSSTEVLNDHKSFLFDPAQRLLVIPIKEDLSEEHDYYSREYFRGAYAFEINGDGIELIKKITHYEGKEEENNYYYWTNPNDVRRSIWMDNILYTLSESKIIASDINNSLSEINQIDLEYEFENNYYPEIYY